jgi:hypothetical protein
VWKLVARRKDQDAMELTISKIRVLYIAIGDLRE